jgi:hypothetical protein
MSDATFEPSYGPVPIPVRELVPWAIFGGLLLSLAIYFVGAEEGATSFQACMFTNLYMMAATCLASPATNAWRAKACPRALTRGCTAVLR